MARCWVSEASDAGWEGSPGRGWLGFLLFDSWIVDASRPRFVCPFTGVDRVVVCSVIVRNECSFVS